MNYAEASIPEKATRLDWSDLAQSKSLERVQRWAAGYPGEWVGSTAATADVGRGLFLHGDVGSGKSTAAGMVLKAVVDHGHAGWFIPVTSLEVLLHRQMDLSTYMRKVDFLDEETQETFEQLNARLTKVRMRYYVVVLDDWGRERMSSTFLQDYTEGLLRERFNRGLPSIITTNLSRMEIEAAVSRPFASFLQEAFNFIDFGSRDFRAEG